MSSQKYFLSHQSHAHSWVVLDDNYDFIFSNAFLSLNPSKKSLSQANDVSYRGSLSVRSHHPIPILLLPTHNSQFLAALHWLRMWKDSKVCARNPGWVFWPDWLLRCTLSKPDTVRGDHWPLWSEGMRSLGGFWTEFLVCCLHKLNHRFRISILARLNSADGNLWYLL